MTSIDWIPMFPMYTVVFFIFLTILMLRNICSRPMQFIRYVRTLAFNICSVKHMKLMFYYKFITF